MVDLLKHARVSKYDIFMIYIHLFGLGQTDGFDSLHVILVEHELISQRQQTQYLHERLTAHFRHPVKKYQLFFRPTRIVQQMCFQFLKNLHYVYIYIMPFEWGGGGDIITFLHDDNTRIIQ